MLPTMLLNCPRNPLRQPDRHWLRAADLAARCEPASGPYDDVWTARALRLATALHQAGAGGQPPSPEMGPYREAHDLYMDKDSLRRWEVEARLLAGESDKEIAARCGLTPEAVRCYHGVYFNVRDFLEIDGYILAVVIGPKAHYGLREGDRDVLLKLQAHEFGSAGVDALLRYWSDPPVVPGRLDQLGLDELRDLHGRLLTRAVVLLRTLPVNAETAPRILRLHASGWGRRPADAGAGEAPAVLADIRCLVDCLETLACTPRKDSEGQRGDAGAPEHAGEQEVVA
jgi:hypothetical protein